jgi:hypothetical protein
MREIIIVLLLTFLVSATATANINNVTGDYRPQYIFLSNNYNPFIELESFPEDFWDIREQFATQNILASHLGKNYYQPELLQPVWNQSCMEWYGSNKIYDFQGIFIYPSRFDVYNIHNNDSLIISAFIYAHPCVNTFQGTQIYLVFDAEAVRVELLTNDTYVLSSTYPVFHPGWMQVVELRFTILDENKSSNIAIREKDPPFGFNEAMKNIYGAENYSECQELLSERINVCTVFIYGRGELFNQSGQLEQSNSISIPVIIGGFIIFLIMMLWLKYVIYKRRKDRQENI